MNGDESHARNLIEQACSAWRHRDRDGSIQDHPAWHDLSAAQRVEVFDATVALRRIEAALDPWGLSSTGRAVMARIMQ